MRANFTLLVTIKWYANCLYLFILSFIFSCTQSPSQYAPIDEDKEGGYQKYFEETRRAALGENWESITRQNFDRASQERLLQTRDVFAGGFLQGNWYERGSSNVAGSTVATYFYPSTEEIYAISSSGTIYKGGLTGSGWTILKEAINFNNQILAVTPNGMGKRIIAAKSDKKIYYSDNEGGSWTQASGMSFYDGWGSGGKKLIVLSNGVMYYLVHTWLASPDTWGSGYKLFRSADNGATWTTTRTFNLKNDGKVVMWSPFGSDELYVMDSGSTLYSLSGTATSLSTTTTAMALPSGDYTLTGYKNGTSLTLYALVNSDALYKTTDNGANWSNVLTFTTASPALPTAWSVGVVANPWLAGALYYGAVDFRKSSNDGASWIAQNGWGAYYGNIDLLHADIMSITPFQKTDGTKFFLIGNHGGIHYYPDPYTTTTNLTKTTFTNTEYYDVVTIGNTIFAGAQDQGNQRFSGGTGTNILTASQLISGDYVRLNTSVNNTKYWQEYPGGTIHYYNAPLTQQYTTAQGTVRGTERTNIQQWVVPTCNWAVASENSILVGGGMAAGGSTESHVVKMTYNGTSTLVKNEYAYDFMANGSGYISAIDHSPNDANYMYVGLNNGKFFYSRDGGTNWTQTVGFTGPTNGWNYGSFIHASRMNKNLVFYCGNGGKIYKTTDGGVTFSNMSTGLPNTFVNEMVLNTNESLLFAATDAGPYICVLSTGQWYSMATTTTPVKSFTAVEYIASDNIVRFATFGRGIWDFQVTSSPLPVELADFKGNVEKNQTVSLSWTTQSEKNVSHFAVERSLDGQKFETIKTVGSKSKNGNSTTIQNYSAQDLLPPQGLIYYRLKTHDLDKQTSNSKIISLNIEKNISEKKWSVLPSLLAHSSPLSIQAPEAIDNLTLSLFDLSGRLIFKKSVVDGTQIDLSRIQQKGVLIYRLENGQHTEIGKIFMY